LGEIEAIGPPGEPGWAEHISATPVLAWKARDVRMHRGGRPWIWRPPPALRFSCQPSPRLDECSDPFFPWGGSAPAPGSRAAR
jgi:hypothetical protein